MKKPAVSIIIVNYRVKNELLDLVESFYKSKTKTDFEIIVIDNSEKDELSSELYSKFPKVRYKKSSDNLGYGAGNNLGAKSSEGEFLFIINPDTKLLSGDIAKLVEFIKKNKKTGAVSPLLIGNDKKPYQQGTKNLTPYRAIFALSFINKMFPSNPVSRKYWNLEWDRNSVREVDVVPGTAFVIKKDLFEKIGGFDENYFLFFEEFDLCLRLKRRGFKNYIIPGVKIYHKWGASTKKNSLSEKYFLRSRFYYFKKNFGVINALFVSAFLGINKRTLLILLIILFIIYFIT